jgi:hypothetical protein
MIPMPSASKANYNGHILQGGIYGAIWYLGKDERSSLKYLHDAFDWVR